ncbi:AAA family ATPase [Nostoc sp. HG1]|nr:AAA family ATPase [Nostoc sp. HG1]
MKPVTIINFGWSKSLHREGLSLDQMQAFDLIHDWYSSNPDMPFVLRGYAGTGKTFLVQRVIQSFQNCFKTQDSEKNKKVALKVALCAPTHKARHVLDAMAQQAGLTVHISTLHSLLHVMPGGEYDENGKQQLKPNTYSREPYYHEFDLVIVDEASMLGQELFKLIPSRVPTIFMGDPAQLPPIEDNVDSSPIFQLPLGMELTQVMRYEGAIATYVTALRQNLNSQFPPRLQSEGNIEKMQFDNWIAAAIDAYKFSRSSAKILAWTNNQVNNLNQQIRAALYPGAEPIEIGEILFAKEPIFLNADSGEQKEIFIIPVLNAK